MKPETVRAKTKKFMEDEELSLREIARRSAIPASTLSYFLDEKIKRELSRPQLRKLIRAIDPAKEDLSLKTSEIYKTLRKQDYDKIEISIIAENLGKMAQLLTSTILNNGEQFGT